MSLKNTSGCLGYQQVTAMAAATGLNPPAGATYAIIQAEAQAVRWRDDNGVPSAVPPTATVGMLIPAGGELRYDGNLNTIRFIQATAGAILNVSFYN